MFQLPVGILGVSIGNSNLVHFSQAWKEKNFDKAKEYIGEAIVYDETSSVVLEHYGDVLIELNEIDEALIFYKKAFELDSENIKLAEKISNYNSRVSNE